MGESRYSISMELDSRNMDGVNRVVVTSEYIEWTGSARGPEYRRNFRMNVH